jgi:hypothetical protein
MKQWLLICVLLAVTLVKASVVGIDYGTDWFKVSLIKPVGRACLNERQLWTPNQDGCKWIGPGD